MHAPSKFSIYGAVTVAGLGVAYDSDLFGPTDCFDHSAPFMVGARSTGSLSISNGILSMSDTITGQDFAVPLPAQMRVTRAST
jgi:hypothetical protein